MTRKFDVFRPRSEPAASIFQAEASLRSERSVDEWIRREREAVYNAALNHCTMAGRAPLSMEAVALAERTALGHVDYAAKWALRVAEALAGS